MIPHHEPDAATGLAGRRAQRRGRSPLILAALSLLAFALVLILVVLGDTTAFDLRLTLDWQHVRLPGLLPLMQAVSWVGFTPQATYLGGGILLLLLALRLRLEAFFALLAFLCGMLSGAIKAAVARPRPVAVEGLIVEFPVGGYSFPSGHVLTYVLFCGFLAYLAYTLVRWRPLRWGLLTLLLGLIALVGPSRVYLGQHWATDTLASYFLGTAILLALLGLYRAAKARQLATTP
ncbi:MAG TPA: phosphatase PAP2 family protein [Thermomicrobiales bacterium]|jgi:undecaprenyl-diphosphatase